MKMRKILITGASSGIGRCLYDYYGATSQVFGVSRRGPDLFVDLSGNDAIERIRNFFVSYEVDVVILNAGIMPFDDLLADDVYKLNLKFNWNFLNCIDSGEFNMPGDGGCVILNASVSGVVGDVDVVFYAAMKAALINLGMSYAKKLACRNIRVNCISPGFINNTDLVPGSPPPEELLDRVPLGKRSANPEELIPIIDALIDCKYITGQNIVVDGGMSL